MDFSQYPATRAEALARQSKFYFNGKPCKHGHIAPRKARTGFCVICLRKSEDKSNSKRGEYFRAYNRSDTGKAAKRKYYDNNRQIAHAKTKARDARTRQATPPWLSYMQKREMHALYRAAQELSKVEKTNYAVDHIYPIKNDAVCGLHVPWNMQILSQKDNREKWNRLPPEGQELAFPPLKTR